MKRKILVNRSNIWFWCGIILMLVICIVHSIGAGHYADYYPINGTFQNYNPIRRMLNGQIPYRDFQDYLGLGHLYLGSLLTFLFGGSYKASLKAFSFLTFGGLAIVTLMIMLAVFNKKKEIAVAVTNIILLMLLIEPVFFKNVLVGNNDILEALEYALGTGNSARFIRGMIVPVSCFLIWCIYNIVITIFSRKKKCINKEKVFFISVGITAGFSVLWSNDYGISCWVCLCIISIWIVLCRCRRIVKVIKIGIGEILLSTISVMVIGEIVTVGHFLNWLSSTFGTGGYQSWYYNSAKSYYLYDVDVSYIMLIQLGIAIIYLMKIFIAKGSEYAIKRYGIPAFANMTCFCAVNEYKILSGGMSREVALTVLYVTIIAEIVKKVAALVNSKIKLENAVKYITLFVGMTWIIAQVKDELVFAFMDKKDGVYIEQLGGNVTNLGEDILKTDAFLNGDDFWATYASAQEVVANTFQPSGTDYIIHVLGDSARQKYMSLFEEKKFKYVATIREEYTDWEFWVQRANWFFYRELYANWHPVFANSYELYWEKNTTESNNSISENINTRIEDIDETKKKIIVECESSVNGIADVYIDYAVRKKDNNSARIMINKNLKVENSGDLYAQEAAYEVTYLRDRSKEYIPISITNGYGEVILTSNPEKSTFLELNQAKCEQIYTVTADYAKVEQVSLNSGETILSVSNNKKNQIILGNVKKIKYNGKIWTVSKCTEDENDIYLQVEGLIDFDERNQIEIVG